VTDESKPTARVARLTFNARVIEDRLECARGEVLDAARRTSKSQHCLRRKNDERALRLRVGLASQEMKIRRRCRRTRNGHVAFGGQLKITLDSRR
jgi:hypothetical protein